MADSMSKAIGRPSKYKPEFDKQAYRLCLLSATDKEIASFFDTTEATINAWKQEYPSFLESLKAGKEEADSKVARRLYERAMGYSHPEDKIFVSGGETVVVPTTKHYPPDSTAAIFWLKNRQPQKWRDRKEVDATLFNGGDVASLPPEVQLEIYKRAIAQIEQRLLVEGSDQKQGSE